MRRLERHQQGDSPGVQRLGPPPQHRADQVVATPEMVVHRRHIHPGLLLDLPYRHRLHAMTGEEGLGGEQDLFGGVDAADSIT